MTTRTAWTTHDHFDEEWHKVERLNAARREQPGHIARRRAAVVAIALEVAARSPELGQEIEEVSPGWYRLRLRDEEGTTIGFL